MTTETNIMRAVQVAASQYGSRLFRNSTGFCTCRGQPIRYGIPSAGGGADLLGWTTRNGVAVFTALEIKTPQGRITSAQSNFLVRIQQAGGIAGVARSVSDALDILNRRI